jgi:chloramphenicol O-acetyltransferase type A
MNYRRLNIDNWQRLEQYQFFKKYDNPFFNICASIDVSDLLARTQSLNLSFSTSLLFASIDTANKVDEFKYRIKDDGVVIYDSIYAGSTILNDDETFNFCYFDYFSKFSDFSQNANKQIRLNKQGQLRFDGRNNDLDIIHYSVIPWISFTSFSHPRNYQTNDSIPKIVFGKYYENNGRTILPVSIEVHHALMDGFHLGLYLEKLQKKVNTPTFLTD